MIQAKFSVEIHKCVMIFTQVQLASAASDKQRLEDRLRSVNDSGQKTIRTLENRVTSLQADLDLAKTEMTSVHTEYEGYKVGITVTRLRCLVTNEG